MGDAPDDRWMTITEAARALGVTRQAIVNRVNRGTLDVRFNNHNKRVVRIQATVLPAISVLHGATPVAPPEPETPAGLVSLADLRMLLGEATTRHTEALVAVERAHRESVALLVERVDAAEIRAERLEDRLAERDRPWWSWWFGQSKHSNLSV